MPNGGLDPAPAQVDWPTPAELSYSLTLNGQPQSKIGIAWGPPDPQTGMRDPSKIQTRMVFPTARVRFGPFHLSASIDTLGNHPLPPGISTTFDISVWGRSPALYLPDGRYLGANLHMVQLGETREVIMGAEGERDVFVIATLPSILTVVQLRASITGHVGGQSFTFPANCGDLPELSGNLGMDVGCLQAAVNPLAVLVPKLLPLSIIYEPPGNCSYANLTHEHTAGAAITVQQSDSTSSHTITDTSILGFSIDHADFSEEKISEKEVTSRVIVTSGQSFGTRLGLPVTNPGDPRCDEPDVTVPARANSGPGKGDVFIFLTNPPLLYWDTADTFNFLFAEQSPPGVPSSNILQVPAWQIATGEGLAELGLSLTEEERKTILALDPFTALDLSFAGPGPFEEPKLPKRFVRVVNDPFVLPAGLGVGVDEMQQFITAGKISDTVKQAETQGDGTTEPDPLSRLILKGLVLGGGFAAGAAAGAAVTAIENQWGSGASQKDATDVADMVKKISIPDLYSQTTQTTTTVTYARSDAIETVRGDAIIQHFLVKDSNNAMRVALYYDTFFGTFAFLPLPPSS
jgi:hypothetical protein